MRVLRSFLLLAATMALSTAHACSCFGNNSYCETLSPGWPSNPDATALVVKLGDIHYGIQVKVLHVFGDGTTNNDTITVWGDQGILCRHYLNGIAVGDTLVMGLNITDLSGNMFPNQEYPPDLEDPEDYMLSICGVHAMDYVNGQVYGWITGPAMEIMSMTDFDDLVRSCSIGTGMDERMVDEPLSVVYHEGRPVVQFRNTQDALTLHVLDVQGRTVLQRNWNGSPYPVQVSAAGVYTVEVRTAAARWTRRVVVP